MHPLIEAHRAEIRALAERHGLRDVRVFGSMARGDATDLRDPLILQYEPNRKQVLSEDRTYRILKFAE